MRQLDYQRHEVRVSDHRPVTGNFRLWVKKVDPMGRAKAWLESQERFENVRAQIIANEKCVTAVFRFSPFPFPRLIHADHIYHYPRLTYLVETCGFDRHTSQSFLEQGSLKRAHR